jgi:hypothetical protein
MKIKYFKFFWLKYFHVKIKYFNFVLTKNIFKNYTKTITSIIFFIFKIKQFISSTHITVLISCFPCTLHYTTFIYETIIPPIDNRKIHIGTLCIFYRFPKIVSIKKNPKKEKKNYRVMTQFNLSQVIFF